MPAAHTKEKQDGKEDLFVKQENCIPMKCIHLGRRTRYPETLAVLSRAAVICALGSPIGIGHDGNPLSILLAAALVSNIRRAGGKAVQIESAENAACRFSCCAVMGTNGAALHFFGKILPNYAENPQISYSDNWQNP